MVLEAAVYGHADFIISGDEDLLTLNPHREIKILSPVDSLTGKYTKVVPCAQ